MQQTILRYPRLDTVLMVEKFVQKHSGDYKKSNLWKHLPKKMMYQTYCVVLDYLITSGKIATDRKGNIVWVWDPEGVKRYLQRKDLVVRKKASPEMSERLERVFETLEFLHEIENGAREASRVEKAE